MSIGEKGAVCLPVGGVFGFGGRGLAPLLPAGRLEGVFREENHTA